MHSIQLLLLRFFYITHVSGFKNKIKIIFFCFYFRKCARIPSNDRKTKKPQKIEEQNSTKSDEATESFSWRIFYASIPFQFLLLAAIFLAWTYEPKCCEATNSYVLLPQLRYMNGPPPI